MAEIETSGFTKAIRNTEKFADDLENGEVYDEVDSEAERLRKAMRNAVLKKGLVETGELAQSFESTHNSTPDGDIWSVFSTKDYAEYLNDGTTPHTIRAKDSPVLSFEPENPAEYGDKYDEESGRVAFTSVDHPGTKPFLFAENAQRRWGSTFGTNIKQAVVRSLLKAKFRPSA